MEDKEIVYNERGFHYKTMGDGIPLVLIHGFAEDHDVWRYQQEALAKHARLIIVDLPGSAGSPIIQDMSMDGQAAFVKKIVDEELKDGSSENARDGVVMIGHSMGGYITLAFANRYAGLLRGFGLFHSTAFADTEEKKATRRRGISFIESHGSQAFISQSAPNLFTEGYRMKNNIIVAEMIERYGSFDPLVLSSCYEAMIARPNLTTVLETFAQPVLFVIGKHDKAIPFEDSMKQCHMPAQAEICILSNAAHMGMWEEQEKSTQALLKFIRTCTR